MAAMRARDVVVWLQRFAHADRYGFLSDIKMREARHHGTRVEIVHPLFEQADGDHLPIHVQQFLYVEPGGDRSGYSGHVNVSLIRGAP